ncbi:MAG: hypothetical protein V4526_02420 [Patescibacteria group bacterium]
MSSPESLTTLKAEGSEEAPKLSPKAALEKIKGEEVARAETKKRKVKQAVKVAADLVEGNRKLQKKAKGKKPEGLNEIVKTVVKKTAAAREKRQKVIEEDKKTREEIETFKNNLKEEGVDAPHERRVEIVKRIHELDEIYAAHDKETGVVYGAASAEENTAVEQEQHMRDTHSRILSQQAEAARDPEQFAAETILATDPELDVSARDLKHAMIPELKSREFKEHAKNKIVETKIAIETASTRYNEFKTTLDKVEANFEGQKKELLDVVEGPERAQRIADLMDTIEKGNNAGFWFPAKKIEAGSNAKADLSNLRNQIDQEFEAKKNLVVTSESDVITILRVLDHVAKEEVFDNARIAAEEANPKSHFFALHAMDQEDPELEGLSRAHVANTTAYTEMRVVADYVRQKAEELLPKFKNLLEDAYNKKRELTDTIYTWIPKESR